MYTFRYPYLRSYLLIIQCHYLVTIKSLRHYSSDKNIAQLFQCYNDASFMKNYSFMGKQDDFFRTQIRIPSDIYEAIKESAEESGRSLNAEMVHLMSVGLDAKTPMRSDNDRHIRELIREELARLTKAGIKLAD